MLFLFPLFLPLQTAIDGLSNQGPQLASPMGQAALDAVFNVPAFKLFLIFDTPWWEGYGFTTGLMHTTLPMRKLYYWRTEKDFGKNNTNSVLMATYGDDASSKYWASMLLDQEPLVPFYFSYNPHMANHSAASPYIDLNGADTRAVVVRDLMQQIRTSHNDQSIPNPFGAGTLPLPLLDS